MKRRVLLTESEFRLPKEIAQEVSYLENSVSKSKKFL